jgi:hypothetical protein
VTGKRDKEKWSAKIRGTKTSTIGRGFGKLGKVISIPRRNAEIKKTLITFWIDTLKDSYLRTCERGIQATSSR